MTLTDDKPTAKKLVCDNCESGDDAESRCNECGVFLCQFCTEAHKRYRSTKLHKLFTIEELKSNAEPQNFAEKVTCSKHKEEIKLFCSTCQTTICRDCTIVDHQGHKYGFVEEVVEEEKQRVQENLDEVKQRKGRVVEGIENLRKFNESLEATKESTINKINKHFEELSRAVESRRKELVEKATAFTHEKQKQVHGQLEALEVALASCQSSIEFTEQAFVNGNAVQVLSMEKYILQSLEQLKTVNDQTEPCVSVGMNFVIPSSVEKIEEMVLNKYDVDVAVPSPLNCEASFNETEASFITDKEYSVTLICKDSSNQRLRYGGDVIEPVLTGMEVRDVAVVDNQDGSYLISFCLRQGGMLKFELSINGTPAPSCSLTKPVQWVISDAVGDGVITNNGLDMRSVCKDGEYSYRVGACFFESGIHTWKVQVHPKSSFFFCRDYDEELLHAYSEVEIGIIDYDDVSANIATSQKKTVYSMETIWVPENLLLFTLSLDMTAKILTVTKGDSRVGNYEFTAKCVSPYFACGFDVTLSLVNEKETTVKGENTVVSSSRFNQHRRPRKARPRVACSSLNNKAVQIRH